MKRFRRAIERLSMLKAMPREELLSSEDALDILENNVRIALEALLDVGRYIIAASGWETPGAYREIPRILARHGVLTREEARLAESLAGLRNVIVHMYADVDYEMLASILDILDKVESLMQRMLNFIVEEGLDP